MTYNQQKQRLQICVTYEDLAFIERFGEKTGAKNASDAIHELIYDYKLMEGGIEKFKKKLIDTTTKETYEEVRNKQLKIPPAPPQTAEDPLKKDEWAWLRGKVEDPNLKSRIDDERFKQTKKRLKK
jgi:hypothetical protein